ncbi:MAG: hypothetical protein HY754_06595 [Nitrospirae bacterium]|nr:hypothetical protein [Nitrospirota bacterium]
MKEDRENNTNNKIALVLGSGATVGGNFKVKYEGKDYEPPMDHNFFETPLVKVILRPKEYPALCYYQKRFKEKSFEATFSKIDLIAKLCLGKVISEEYAYDEIKNLMAEKAKSDTSYKIKMEDECCCWRTPSMAAWEFISLISRIYGKLEIPKKTSPLHDLLRRSLVRRHNLSFPQAERVGNLSEKQRKIPDKPE